MKPLLKPIYYLLILTALMVGCKDTGNSISGLSKDSNSRSSLSTPTSNISVTEGNSIGILVTLDKPITADADLNWNISAPAGQFQTSSGVVHFSKGVTSGFVQIDTLNNAVRDGNRTYRLGLSGPLFVNSLNLDFTILDNETPPTLSLANISVTEGSGAGTTNAVFTVTAPYVSGSNISVSYATSNGTATAGVDYTATSGTLTILAGSLTGTISVPVTRNTTFEPDKTFHLTLTGGSGYSVAGSTLSAVGTIVDDDLSSKVWDFSLSSDYTFDNNYIDFSAGAISLKTVNTTFDSATTLNAGTHYGTYADTSTGRLSIVRSMNTELDSSWTPEWSSIRGYWKLNSDWSDSSGHSNTATPGGSPTFSSSVKRVGAGSSLFAVASADIATFSVAATPTFTMSAWVRPVTVNASIRRIFSCNNFVLRDGGSGALNFGSLYGGFAGATKAGVFVQNQWVHVAGTFDGSVMKVYANGVLVGTATASGPSNLSICTFSNAGERWDGNIDDAVIWSKALNAGQIKTIYYRQSQNYTNELSPSWTPKWSSIIGYWKMDGSWTDSSPSGKNLTASGAGATLQTSGSKIGSGYANFDGTAWAATTASSTYAFPDTTFTLSIWFKATGTGGYMMSNGASTGSGGWTFSTNSTGVVFEARRGSNSMFVSTNLGFNDGSWHHAAIVVTTNTTTQSANLAQIYVDAIPLGTTLMAAGFTYLSPGTTYPLVFGARLTGNNPGVMALDEAAVWSTGLTATDIDLIYNRQKQKYVGSYNSPVIDLGANSAPWPNLSAVTSFPFGKALTPTASSESTTNYADVAGGLSTGLLANWHFDETSGSTFADGAGSSQSAVASGTVISGSPGAFQNAIQINGAGSLTIPNSTTLKPTSFPFTVSLWANFSSNGASVQPLFQNDTWLAGTNFCGVSLQLTGTGLLNASTGNCLGSGSGNKVTFAGSSVLKLGVWYHIVAVFNAVGDTSVFINGIPEAGTYSGSATTLGYSASVGYIGGQSSYIKGRLDEVALWSRGLNSASVLELYRRGINRVKYQVRSCVDADCACRSFSTTPVGSATDCSGNGTADDLTGTDSRQARWIGPDGTSATYFSEIQNNSSVDAVGNPTGTVLATGLNLDWSSSFFTAAARPTANRYFQYRVFLESDDEVGLCSGSSICLPQLTSVTVGPANRRWGGSPSIVNNTAHAYNQLQSIARTDTGSCTTYQISTDSGSTWRYWDGSAWSPASNSAQSNYLSDFEGRLSSLSSGNFKFKAFLNTNTAGDFTSSCTLNSVGIGYIP